MKKSLESAQRALKNAIPAARAEVYKQMDEMRRVAL